MSEHARWSPSSSAMWLNCPGSLNAIDTLPPVEDGEDDTTYSREGRYFHTMLEYAFNVGCQPTFFLHQQAVQKGLWGTPEPEWDLDGGIRAVNFAYHHIRDQQFDQEHAELRVDISTYLGEGQFGTCDHWGIKGAHLHVSDYKHGKGVPVHAEGNSQGRLYALGVLDDLLFTHDGVIEDVTIHIYQPRIDGFEHTSETLTVDELIEWGETVVIPAVAANKKPDAPRIPSQKACQWCPYKGHCPELAEQVFDVVASEFDVLDVAETSTEVTLKNPDTLTRDQLSFVLRNSDDITAFLKACKARAISDMNMGVQIPGFKLVEGRQGNRQWVDEDEARAAVEKIARRTKKKKAEYVEEKFASPTQIEKLFGKKVYQSEFENLVTRAQGSPALVSEADSRPALPASVDLDEFDALD